MCFSATASFSSTIVLSTIGVLTIRKVRNKSQLLLASMPLLFAMQQFIEGLLWLELKAGYNINRYSILTGTYTIFVGVFWSTIPTLSLLMIEPVYWQKNIMKLLLLIGIGVAIYTINGLLQAPISARIGNSCIQYQTIEPHLTLVFYVIATCAAFFVSSHRIINWIGLFYILAFAVTYYFYSYDLASVWCFFAAIISGLIYLQFAHNSNHRIS